MAMFAVLDLRTSQRAKTRVGSCLRRLEWHDHSTRARQRQGERPWRPAQNPAGQQHRTSPLPESNEQEDQVAWPVTEPAAV
jgi:hypothetical protein